MEWVELVGKTKLAMRNRRILVEVASIAAPACKMPSRGKEHSDQEGKHCPWPEAGEVELLLGLYQAPRPREKRTQTHSVFA